MLHMYIMQNTYEGRLKSPCKVREMVLLAHIKVMFS